MGYLLAGVWYFIGVAGLYWTTSNTGGYTQEEMDRMADEAYCEARPQDCSDPWE